MAFIGTALASPEAIERAGSIGLRVAFAAGLTLTALVASLAPDVAPLLPLPLVALGVGVVLLHHPVAYLATVLVLGSALSVRDEGVQLAEVAFFAWLVAFLTQWYARRLARGDRIMYTRADLAAALFIVLGVGGGAVLGVLNGAPMAHFRAEVVACLPFLLYFPIKEAVRGARHGTETVLMAMIWLGLFAAVRNGILMQQALNNADQLWKIADVRYNYGETFLSAGFLLGLTLLASVRSRALQAGLVVAVALLLAGVLLTKSRGFWVSTILGVLAAMAMLKGPARVRLVAFSAVGVVTFALLASVFLGDYLGLLINGIVRRFSTLASATTQDVSLVNRFIETSAAMDRIRTNPILGHGWGIPNSYYSLVMISTVHYAFIHNGYVALWFKVGLWGLGLMLFVWLFAYIGAFRAARSRSLTPTQRAGAAGAGGALVTFGVAAVTSNPFSIPDQMLAVTIVLGLLHGLAQRSAETGTRLSGAER